MTVSKFSKLHQTNRSSEIKRAMEERNESKSKSEKSGSGSDS